MRIDVPLSLVTDFKYPGHSVLRCHAVPDRAGRTLHRALLDHLELRRDIDLMVPAQLVRVDVDHDGVVGAVVGRPDGSHEELETRAVVLATNGFGANSDLVRTLTPEIADGVYHGGDGSKGDALRIAEALGLDTAGLDAYQGHGSLAMPHAILLTWAVVMHGGWIVDASGRRFGDETIGYSEYAAKVIARPGQDAWVVYDERIHDACTPFADYLDVVTSGAVSWADDLSALAIELGIAEDALRDTAEHAAVAARGGGKDPHGRTDWEAPLAAPYAAVRVTGALFHTQGGIRVDRDARALASGAVVPGLYATGGAAVGISGRGADGYLAGNGLLAALGLGYLAGRHLGGSTS